MTSGSILYISLNFIIECPVEISGMFANKQNDIGRQRYKWELLVVSSHIASLSFCGFTLGKMLVAANKRPNIKRC